MGLGADADDRQSALSSRVLVHHVEVGTVLVRHVVVAGRVRRLEWWPNVRAS